MTELDNLLEYLDDVAGSSLRAVGSYRGDAFELRYHRDDLEADKLYDRLEGIHEHVTWDWRPPDDRAITELGGKLASLQIREQAVILHLITGDDRGVLIGLDSDAARDLNAFVVECLDRVDDADLGF